MDTSSSATFGDLLRRNRLAAGLTQEELAEKSQVSPRAISDLERGARSRPWRETIQFLANALCLGSSERAQLEAAARQSSPREAVSLSRESRADRSTPRHNLPLQVTSFIGRERELDDVARLLADTHLLTLTGSGGCGKTRLALEVAGGLLGDYPDGVWLVELAPLADPELVPGVVAAALGVREVYGQPVLTTLLAALSSRRVLLLLDNCEHLIDAGARLVDALLRHCPNVRVLATSREPLRVAGEAVFRVPSLSFPPNTTSLAPEDLARFAAIRLFLDRAQAAGSGLALTSPNASALAQICRRLDGIPLALELAAARTRALTVGQIAARLDGRFQLLVGGNRAALPRQQTLAATVEWSYDLLTALDRTLFNRLAVFAGGFDLEAAEQVCEGSPLAAEDILGLLAGLVERSLVVAELGEDGMERYSLLETLRAYGQERLMAAGEVAQTRDRHRKWCLALAAHAEANLGGARRKEWLDRLDREIDNLRMALEWCQAGDAGLGSGLMLASALMEFWRHRGHVAEGRRHLDALLERAPLSVDARVRERALRSAGHLAMLASDYARSDALLRESLRLWQRSDTSDDRIGPLAILGIVPAIWGTTHARTRSWRSRSRLPARRVAAPTSPTRSISWALWRERRGISIGRRSCSSRAWRCASAWNGSGLPHGPCSSWA
jgi:non-specific serine/threonine protein kinase